MKKPKVGDVRVFMACGDPIIYRWNLYGSPRLEDCIKIYHVGSDPGDGYPHYVISDAAPKANEVLVLKCAHVLTAGKCAIWEEVTDEEA